MRYFFLANGLQGHEVDSHWGTEDVNILLMLGADLTDLGQNLSTSSEVRIHLSRTRKDMHDLLRSGIS